MTNDFTVSTCNMVAKTLVSSTWQYAYDSTNPIHTDMGGYNSFFDNISPGCSNEPPSCSLVSVSQAAPNFYGPITGKRYHANLNDPNVL